MLAIGIALAAAWLIVGRRALPGRVATVMRG
jgi:hypothetical protein